MAHIYQTPSGTWRAQVKKRGAKKSFNAKSREEVEVWAQAAERVIDERHRVVKVINSDDPPAVLLVTALPHRLLHALQNVPHAYHEVLEAAVPMGQNCGVYFLIHKRQVMYVGQSINIFNRLAKHVRSGSVFDSYALISCRPYMLDYLEALYINAFFPPLNTSTPVVPPHPGDGPEGHDAREDWLPMLAEIDSD